MKYLVSFVLLLFVVSCKPKEKCRFSTVTDLDNLDLRECPPGDFFHHDTLYYHNIKKFSSGFDNYRKEKGIPALPKDFQVITWSVDNQVRWRNAEMIKRISVDSNIRQPYMQRKDLEWDEDGLSYDYTYFTAMDSLNSWLWIGWIRDFYGKYSFQFSYSNKAIPDGWDITKKQADSILKTWKIDY